MSALDIEEGSDGIAFGPFQKSKDQILQQRSV
jgi:hypothetical protein